MKHRSTTNLALVLATGLSALACSSTDTGGGVPATGGQSAGGGSNTAGAPAAGSSTAGAFNNGAAGASTGDISAGSNSVAGNNNAGSGAESAAAGAGGSAQGGNSAAGSSAAGSSAAGAGPVGPVDGSASAWHCVNWAVNGDNFQTGPLLLSGIFTSDTTYDAVKTHAAAVVAAYSDQLKANSFRIPINEPTVNNATNWANYKAVIDAGTAKQMKVLLGFWAKDTNVGKPVDINAWYTMWQTVIKDYIDNPNVFFDIHNEPHGYSNQQWIQQVKDWMAKFPNVPKSRIIVAGTGWDDNVSNVASAFPDMPLYEVHDYVFNGNFTNPSQWSNQLLGRLGNGKSKTIVGEFGATVSGKDFTGTSDANTAFMAGFTDAIHDNKMGSCWWPGLWAIPSSSSSWGLLKMSGSGTNVTYTINNQSALDRIWHSWGLK